MPTLIRAIAISIIIPLSIGRQTENPTMVVKLLTNSYSLQT